MTAYGGHPQTVRDLIRSGAIVTALDRQGRSAADWAREGQSENEGGRKSRSDQFIAVLGQLKVAKGSGGARVAKGLKQPTHI